MVQLKKNIIFRGFLLDIRHLNCVYTQDRPVLELRQENKKLGRSLSKGNGETETIADLYWPHPAP